MKRVESWYLTSDTNIFTSLINMLLNGTGLSIIFITNFKTDRLRQQKHTKMYLNSLSTEAAVHDVIILSDETMP